MTQREAFVAWCLEQEAKGAVYIWGGEGEPVSLPDGRIVPGFDCSGLVLTGYAVLGVKPPKGKTWVAWWSQRLFDELVPTTEPEAGDLAFYGHGPEGVSHVVVCLGGKTGPIIGANGGNRSTTTAARALQQGARVKQKPSPRYRPDLLGFRRSPFVEGAR